jgi:hypothetical protein
MRYEIICIDGPAAGRHIFNEVPDYPKAGDGLIVRSTDYVLTKSGGHRAGAARPAHEAATG